MEKWVDQVAQLLAKAHSNAGSGRFGGSAAANDDGPKTPAFDMADADTDGTLTRVDRALLISDIIRIAADDGWDSVVERALRAAGVPSLAHATDDDLIELFVYLDHELRLEAI